jgi:hypothetical protein
VGIIISWKHERFMTEKASTLLSCNENARKKFFFSLFIIENSHQ